MSSSRRELILARFADALTAALPDVSVARDPEIAITRKVSPKLAVLYGGTPEIERRGSVDRHRMQVRLAIFVRGDVWTTLADAVDRRAHAALFQDLANPAGLQALAIGLLRTGDNPEAEEADLTAGTLVVDYSVLFMTRADDITAAP